MRTLVACLALSALLVVGCGVGPRPGNWEASATVPGITLVERLVSLPDGAVVAVGQAPDHHAAAAVFDSLHSRWLPPAESPLVDGAWTINPLAGSEVLVTSLESNWRFRPSTASWRPAAAMTHPRYAYANSSLADGRLFVCGGTDDSHLALGTCEIYDPSADRWVSTASMSTPRFGPLAATLSDGRVFVTGGAFNPTQDGSFDLGLDPLDTSETFNPTTAAFSPGPAFLDPVTDPTLVGLANGRLLAIGGRQGFMTRSQITQELDPGTGRWSLRASPTAAGQGILLPDGRVLVIGIPPGRGLFFDGVSQAAIYDPPIDLWTPVTPAPSGYTPGHAARLPDGRVLTVGVGDQPASAVFDPRAVPPLPGSDLPLASRSTVLGLGAVVGALLLLLLARAVRRRR